MKRIFCIGGGELKNFTTLKLDEYIAAASKEHAGDKRAYALFIPTASHDCMPYYNTFHKVYTGKFDIKTDVALTVNREFDIEKIKQKFLKADLIYIGGGDTLFMIESMKQTGLYDLLIDAYNRGVIIAGLSAGAICYFEDIYTDSSIENSTTKYSMAKGMGLVKGVISPHYDERVNDFDEIVLKQYAEAYGIENDAMIEIDDGIITRSFSSNEKNAYLLKNKDGKLEKHIIESVIKL